MCRRLVTLCVALAMMWTGYTGAAAAQCCEYWWIVCNVEFWLFGGQSGVLCTGIIQGLHEGSPVVNGVFKARFDQTNTLSCTQVAANGEFYINDALAETFALTAIGPNGVVTTGGGGGGDVVLARTSPPGPTVCGGRVTISGVIASP